MSDDRDEAHRKFLIALLEQLEALGWEIEYAPGGWPRGEVEVWYPDPKTGHAMQFSGWWISWRPVDGVVTYGIGDDIGDPWRAELGVTEPSNGRAVANAADRAMHMLWHLDERDLHAKLYAEAAQASRFRSRVTELSSRPFVTPGQLREALKSTAKERP